MNIQIFGTRKCADTRKAERWFKERSIRFQGIDLAQKAMSPRELRSVAARVPGGMAALIDTESKLYLELGLRYASPTGERLEKLLLERPLLLRTPIVRNGPLATLGYQPEVWAGWK